MKNKKKDPLEGTVVESVPEFDLEASEKALEEIVAANDWKPRPEETKAPEPPAWNRDPQFLGDWSLRTEGEIAKIAWASEEGIKRVEIPAWLVERLHWAYETSKGK